MSQATSNPAALRRRRMIGISAAAGGLALLPPLGRRGNAKPPLLRIWRGAVLGADAVLQIHHPDPAIAERLIQASLAEAERLERVLSLYRSDSALARLNRDGALADPPADLVRLLGEAALYSRLTSGAFDLTVQPLWDVYASHFAQSDADPAGPPAEAIAAAVARVGHDRVEADPALVRFTRPGVAITPNGIGQGYVTDRVVELLLREGIEHALVDMGETRAIGGYPGAGPWQIGLEDPAAPGQVAETIPLADCAVATSGGYGTVFDPSGRFNHILEPQTGRTSWRYKAVSVIAPSATMADALSTAFCLMPLGRAQKVARRLGIVAHFALDDGRRLVQ